MKDPDSLFFCSCMLPFPPKFFRYHKEKIVGRREAKQKASTGDEEKEARGQCC